MARAVTVQEVAQTLRVALAEMDLAIRAMQTQRDVIAALLALTEERLED